MTGVPRFFGLFALIILANAEGGQQPAEPHSCITQADYDSANGKIETLEKRLEASRALEDELIELKKQHSSVSTEKSNCDIASATLFQRSIDLENLKRNLESDIEEKVLALSSCKDEVNSLAQSSIALSSCQSKLESSQSNLDICGKQTTERKVELETAQKKLREQELSFQSDVRKLKTLMQNAEVKYKDDIKTIKKELASANFRLAKVSQDSYLFSFAQFKRAVARVAALNKAFASFIMINVEPLVPPSFAEDIQMYYTQTKLVSIGLYKTHMQPYVTSLTLSALPHLAGFRKLYSEHVEKSIDGTRKALTTRASAAWDEGKALTRKYSQLAGAWSEENLIQPFIQSHPGLEEIIPDTPIDRFFALAYLIIIMLVSAYISRFVFLYGIRPVLRLVGYTLMMPCRIIGFIFGLCWKRKHQSSKKTTKKELKKEAFAPARKDFTSLKDEKKDAPKKTPTRA